VGALGGARAHPVDVRDVFLAAASLRAVAVGSRAQFIAMNRAISLHRVRPIIDRTFGFDDAPAAFAYHATGAAFGKVVIRISEGGSS